MTTKKYKLDIQIIGNNINKVIYKYYDEINELYEILEVFTKLELLINNIDILKISFNILNPTSNILDVNNFTNKILDSYFVKEFCKINKSKILFLDEEVKSIRQFNIILDNDESYKFMDLHILRKGRLDYNKERMLIANP